MTKTVMQTAARSVVAWRRTTSCSAPPAWRRTTAGVRPLAEKTWVRRAVVAHGVSACGAANFEEVPGREQYGVGDDATAQWADDILAYHEENFLNDKGIEARKGFIIILPHPGGI